jgi:hypothetical protein
MVNDGKMMWKETVKANCSRDRTKAERSIVRPYRHKLNKLHANTRQVSIVSSRRTAEVREETSPYAVSGNLVIGSAAIYCMLVVQGSVFVERP